MRSLCSGANMKTIRDYCIAIPKFCLLPIKFVLCGGFTTALNIVTRFVLSFWLPYWVAIVLGYSLGMLIGFLLFKKVVFNVHDSIHLSQEILFYLLVNAGSLLITLFVSLWAKNNLFPLIGFTFRPADIAHMVGVFCGACSNYLGHKYVTFKR